MGNFDLLNLAVKTFAPTNEVLLDDKGMPSVYVRIPKFKISDVITGGSDSVHPAFIVNGQEIDEIYISKYQNIIVNDRAYSLPGQDPAVNLNFDRAVTVCKNKGAGFHLMTNAEWAAIALWCRKNSCMPKGNNYYGRDSADSTYEAIAASRETSGDNIGRINRVLTGTGPVSWSHNGERSGIWDLNGNVYEWVGGYRTVAGEIQVLANNNAADSSLSQAADSAQWKAILSDGTLVAPGTTNTLKWDYTADPGTTSASKAFELATALAHQQTVDAPYGGQSFETLTAHAGVSVPELLKALALFPADANSHGGDYFYMRNQAADERLLLRGGDWHYGAFSGVFCGYGSYVRSYAYGGLGFRSAFVNLPSAS